MIDYTNENYAASPFYEEAVKRYSPFTGTSYEAGVTISDRPVKIYALLGGQWPHSSFMALGGVMCAPTLTDVTRANSDLGMFWRMSKDIGLDKYGKGHGRFTTWWGYLPHEDHYQNPTIAGRADAVIMKSGIYDGASDSFLKMD